VVVDRQRAALARHFKGSQQNIFLPMVKTFPKAAAKRWVAMVAHEVQRSWTMSNRLPNQAPCVL
jgi:hypothetical protein